MPCEQIEARSFSISMMRSIIPRFSSRPGKCPPVLPERIHELKPKLHASLHQTRHPRHKAAPPICNVEFIA